MVSQDPLRSTDLIVGGPSYRDAVITVTTAWGEPADALGSGGVLTDPTRPVGLPDPGEVLRRGHADPMSAETP